MFTIKLYQDPYKYNVIETPNYEVDMNSEIGVVTVTVFKDYTICDGTEYKVSQKDIEIYHWKYAYIENSSGKTIDHIRPENNVTKEFIVNLKGHVSDKFL